MFTIKRVTKDSNRQNPSGDRIELWQGRNANTSFNDATGKAEFHFTMDDGTYCSIDTGLIFVMNEAGKTVEIVRLTGSEWF